MLTGIVNKKRLIEVQRKILDVAKYLKESTKKLIRLFKENPDIEGDARKVSDERVFLIKELEDLVNYVQGGSLAKF